MSAGMRTPQRLASQQAMPVHDVSQRTCGRALARGALRRVESGDVQLERHAARAQQRSRLEEHGLVLHRPEVGDVQQPRGARRGARTGSTRRPAVERDTEWHERRVNAERAGQLVHVRCADGDAGRAGRDETGLEPPPPAELRPVADLRQADELTTGEVCEQRKAEPRRRGDGVQRGAAEQRVHDVEWGNAMLTGEQPVETE